MYGKKDPTSHTYLRDRHPSGSFDHIFIIFCELFHFTETGYYSGLWDYYKKESGKYNIPEAVTTLVDTGLGCIIKGDNDKKFNFALEYEYANVMRKWSSLSETEFLLLWLAKELLQELRTANYNDFLVLSASFGSSELQTKLQDIRAQKKLPKQ